MTNQMPDKALDRCEWYARREIQYQARIAELEAALRKLTTLSANVCTATDGIGVINRVAELRPAIPEMRAALAK